MAEGYSYQTKTVNTFSTVDYVIFAGILIGSSGIGVFYAIRDRKQNNLRQFLLAGKNMSVFPVALSLVASFMSAITLLGTPAEMYNHGTMFAWIGLSYIFAVAMAAHIYVPIFYNLKITSAYEYLSLRFGNAVRTLAALIYVVQMLLYMAIVLYAPSLALSAVTGFTLWGSVVSVATICTLYTAIGGMKAVLWTDSFQMAMMTAGLIAIIIRGSIVMGGYEQAWNIASLNHRINFSDFSFDPTVRHTFWSLVIGGAFTWGATYGTNQAQVQRTLTCPTLRKAQIALWLNLPGLWCVLYFSCIIGILVYAFYSTCDPISYDLVGANDQLLPLFVMDVLGPIPGLPGLFVSCIFSGALSTVSSGLNALAAVIMEDVIKIYISKDIGDARATFVSKVLAVVLGVMCLGMTYVASLLGGVLQAALSFNGMIGGVLMGVFSLGMFFPWANHKGAFAGLVLGTGMIFWIGLGSRVNNPPVKPDRPYVNITGCNWNLTTTMSPVTAPGVLTTTLASTTTTMVERSPDYYLYTLSYMWYSVVAVVAVVVFGLIVSFLTGRTKPSTVDPRLVCPFFDIVFPFNFLPESIRKKLRFGIDHEGKEDLPSLTSNLSEEDGKESKADDMEGGPVTFGINNKGDPDGKGDLWKTESSALPTEYRDYRAGDKINSVNEKTSELSNTKVAQDNIAFDPPAYSRVGGTDTTRL